MIKRCSWVNLKNKNYIDYHDNIWSVPVHDDRLLFEYLILEIFQSGLSFEIILNKQKYFEKAFDNFDYRIISNYDDNKVEELLKDKNIIRNKLKIISTINNAKVFLDIINEYGSFDNYIWHFTNKRQVLDKEALNMSDEIYKDLKSKNMKFIGNKIIYSYLETIGVINGHEKECFKR